MSEEAKDLRPDRSGGLSTLSLLRAERAAKSRAAEVEELRRRLEMGRGRLLDAAKAFCDGSISPGQLRAVREFLREQEERLSELEGVSKPPFKEEPLPTAPLADPDIVPAAIDVAGPAQAEPVAPPPPELARGLSELDSKIARLEQDFQQGRVNASQYRAIRKHYLEQRQVALRLKESHPESDRWRVVLQEGKTSFLLQLNEAVCRSVAFYDLRTRERLFMHGEMPPAAEAAMALLGTFGGGKGEGSADRMLSTQTEDGSALLLIPGRYSAALVVFSQEPPGWQVRALREVYRNFEAANKSALDRGNRAALVFPDLSRFVRP